MISLLDYLTRNDQMLFNFINHNLTNPFFDKLMPWLTKIGNIGAVWFLIAVLFFLFGGKKGRRTAVLVIFAGILTDITTELVLKKIVMRPRPYLVMSGVRLLVPKLTSFSFPSGHAAISLAAGLILAKNYKKFSWFFITLALAISFSRIYVGVHYPIDVLSGALVGITVAYLLLKHQYRINDFMDEVREKYFRRQKQ